MVSKRGNNLLKQYIKLTEEEQCKFIDNINKYDIHKFFKGLNMKEPDYSTYKKFLKGARKDG